VIFVIGPDNKIYAGQKARAKSGELGAFNHSSFFSGGPVRSAGTLHIQGGRIASVSNESGHYSPTATMIQTAVRKFGGSDGTWLDEVLVFIGRKSSSGRVFLEGQYKKDQLEIWGKYSLGQLTETRAGQILESAEAGSWIVWHKGKKDLKLSHNKGGGLAHLPISELGNQGLDRKKLLTQDKLPKITSEPETTGKPKKQDKSAPPEPEKLEALKNTVAWHANANSTQATKLVEGKPDGTFLIRPSSKGGIALTYVEGGSVKHALLDKVSNYEWYLQFARENRAKQVKPAPSSGLSSTLEAELKESPAWHAGVNTETAEAMLEPAPIHSWFLRPSSQGGVVLSRRIAKGPEHHRIFNEKAYQLYKEHADKYPTMMIEP
jgi:hypothetical protein